MDRLVGGVGVLVPSRKAAAGDLNPQPVPPQKNVARRPEIYLMTLCATGAEDASAWKNPLSCFARPSGHDVSSRQTLRPITKIRTGAEERSTVRSSAR